MEFEFKQGKDYIELGDSFEVLKKLREDFKENQFDEKPLLSRLYNKFSGEYFSPTFLKSFIQCPMKCFLNYFDKKETTPILNLGSATHKVYERIVGEKALTKSAQEAIANEEFKNFNLTPSQKSTYVKYINNFIKFDNYDGIKLFSRDDIKYFPEYHMNEKNLNILNCDLGACYTLLDRLDIKESKREINIVDYKTGRISDIGHIVESYTDQFITYYWLTSINFPGFDVNSYIYLPENNSFVKVDTEDIEKQSRYIDKIYDFYDFIHDCREKNIFPAITNEYCKYCSQSERCNAYNKDKTTEIIRKEVEDDGLKENSTEKS